MWYTLKAELLYYSKNYLSAWGVCLGAVILLNYKQADHIYEMVVTFSILVSIFFVAGLGINSDTEKRNRFLQLIPVSRSQWMNVQIVTLAVYQVGLALIWLVAALLDPDNPIRSVLPSIATNSVIFLNYAFAIWAFGEMGKVRPVLYRVIFFIIIAVGIDLTFLLGKKAGYSIDGLFLLHGEFLKTWEALILNSVILVFLVVTVRILFQKRHSYLV